MTDKKSSSGLMFNALCLLMAFAITMVCVVTGAYIQEGYLINAGGVSPKRFKAPSTIENKVATERNRQAALEASEKLDPITVRDETVAAALEDSLDAFFLSADELRRQQLNIFTPYNTPAAGDEIASGETAESIPAQMPMSAPRLEGLSESATRTLLDMDSVRYSMFALDVHDVAQRILATGVQELDTKTLMAVKDEMDKLDLNSETRSLGYDIITLYLSPNIKVDEQKTAQTRADRANAYDKVYYLRDQTIVDEGAIISSEAYAALEELGLVKTDYIDNMMPILGAGALVAVIFAVVASYLYFFNEKKVRNRKETMMVFTLYTLVIVLARVFVDMPIQLLPITVFTILVATFFGASMASVTNLAVTIICYIILRGDIEFLLYYSLSGVAVSLVTHFTTDRSRVFLAAAMTSLVNLSLYAAVVLLVQKNYSTELFYNAIFAATAGLLSVIISFGSMPFWEAAFGLVTPIKLLDLTNPDSKLLRRLAIEAPGTYHHSVIVANLAETAAYDIGANLSVARTGGYYHDIGKLKYPNYFAENMVGANPHDDMDAFSSTQVILSHVSYGLELAAANKLPAVIQDIIAQHHGTTMIKYFYHKAMTESPMEEIDESGFRYPHTIPQSKEAAVVMLADTVEAAVRSMIPTGKSMDEVSAFITELVRDKLDDGQLSDSELTIRDLDTVVKSFMRVFRGMYHERIPYPRVDKTRTPKEEASEA